MERRELLKMIVAATGSAFIGSQVLAYDMRPNVTLSDTIFDKDDVTFLNQLGETIIPKTDTPGAKQANVGLMIAIIISDCYTTDEQKIFKQGLLVIDNKAQSTYNNPFLLLSNVQQTELLTAKDAEANQYNKKFRQELKNKTVPVHYFTMLKQLVLFTFFSSEIGATQVLRHVAIPGSYNGDLAYKKGDKAWAR
ncbi:gluconate 2-dehydrogenase subunit 3 family protein [Aliiglaciecola lipolytica]|uniref:Twin-arginine translocation pathway signal n=1 Tax=Aliiglaciecola lipolytica E3 TaxID=1127673 RepID=K6YDV5_9ALTE|nr:gluconate 2-dehydrogenase subunit 3 family protein [Aliiglaciecola lipolytica]GAC14793.1 twin-arginine translocation pathway signal [Aliiglaciecola lipolytica E3]